MFFYCDRHYFPRLSSFLRRLGIKTRLLQLLRRLGWQRRSAIAEQMIALQQANAQLRQEVAQWQQRQATLQQQELTLKQAQKIAQIGTWQFDLRSLQTTWSEELYHLHGLDPQQPAPTPAEVILLTHPEDRSIHQREIVERVQLGQAFATEMRIVRPDGTVRQVEAWGEPIWDAQQQLLGYVGVTLDLTERRVMEEKVRQSEIVQRALARERELNRLKTEFMALVTHDFHTPLVSIQGFAALLRQDEAMLTTEMATEMATATRQRYFDRIDTSIAHLRRLLEQVLLMGRSESGKLPCQPTVFDLKAFYSELIELLPDDRSAIEFQYHLDSPKVTLDQTLLRQILLNLFMNAIKYSPEQTPIHFRVDRTENAIEFTVQDQGIGIPAEDQSHLFEPFYRGSNIRSVRGSGLGLAVVKTCVEAQGGQIEIVSQIGQGTTVTVTIPL